MQLLLLKTKYIFSPFPTENLIFPEFLHRIYITNLNSLFQFIGNNSCNHAQYVETLLTKEENKLIN